MFHQFVVWLASAVGQLGYPGIVMLMTSMLTFRNNGNQFSIICMILAFSKSDTDQHGLH